MNQGQVWKKRSAGLTTEYRTEATTWMRSKDSDRATSAATPASQRKAGVKRRKY